MGVSPQPAPPRQWVWQCLKCGYVRVAHDPPTECPDCGAPREKFTILEED